MIKIGLFVGLTLLTVSLTGKINKLKSNPDFSEVKIGKQIWSKQNLNVSTFKNGEVIKEAKTKEEWVEAYSKKIPAWCYYDNSEENGKKYGKLYNFYAVIDSKGLAPQGWHIPSEKEWNELMNGFKNVEFVGEVLKEKTGWNREGNGTNSSGFSALPGGYRYYHGIFSSINSHAYFWSSTEVKPTVGVCSSLICTDGEFYFSEDDKGQGFSVRCVKDL
jgi:uncharacterized protein (TIGR02145 family)